jgi:hypothetical protein
MATTINNQIIVNIADVFFMSDNLVVLNDGRNFYPEEIQIRKYRLDEIALLQFHDILHLINIEDAIDAVRELNFSDKEIDEAIEMKNLGWDEVEKRIFG